MDSIRQNGEMEEYEKGLVLRAMKAKSFADVLEEVGVLVDMNHFIEFMETKSSLDLIARKFNLFRKYEFRLKIGDFWLKLRFS